MKRKSKHTEKISVNFDMPTLSKLRAIGTQRGGQSVASLLRFAVSEMLVREEASTKPAA